MLKIGNLNTKTKFKFSQKRQNSKIFINFSKRIDFVMKSRKVEIKQIIRVMGIIFLFSFLITSNFISFREKNNDSNENDTNLKLSASSNYQLEWYRLWDDTAYQYGMGLDVDSFSNIYQAGRTGGDGVIFKIDSSGNQLWNRTWGSGNNDVGWDIAIDSNNYIYVGGTLNTQPANIQEIILLKYDDSGNQIWNRTWNYLNNAYGKSIIIDSEDNIYILGHSNDLVIIKYNSSGSKIWQEIWGGAQDDGNLGSDLVLDSQDNLYVASSTSSYGAAGSDALIMKYNSSSGSRIWNKTFGGANSDRADGIALDNNDNIYIGGYTNSFGPGASGSAFIAKFDNSGNYLWNKSRAGPDNIIGMGLDLTSDPLGNVYLTGFINIPGFDQELTFLLKYNTSGSLKLNITWGNGLNWCEGFGVHVDSLYNIYISGYVNQYDGKSHTAFLLKYSELNHPGPSITINSPISDQYIGYNAPEFNITIKHHYPLNSKWYSIDGGITNHSVDGTILIETLGGFYYTNVIAEVDQAAWNSVSNDVTIRFYSNDTFGNEGYAEVTVSKDTTAPTSLIAFTPLSGTNIVNYSTTFTLTADDGLGSGVSMIRYIINQSSWITYSSPFDLSSYVYGYNLISYQAIDLVNNTENVNTLLVMLADIPSLSSLTVTSPNTSSSWEPGTSQFINWTSTGSILNVKIELYKNDLFEMEITSSTTNDGEYYWSLYSALIDSNQYQIKITDVSNSSTYDYSDYFEIKNPSLSVTTPDASSSWEPGTSQYINWTSTGSISNIKIELYKNGVFEIEITSSTTNDGEYYWNLYSALTDSNQYQIKITYVSNPSAYDYSDYFEIKNPPSGASPSIPGYNTLLLIGIICMVSVIPFKKRKITVFL